MAAAAIAVAADALGLPGDDALQQAIDAARGLRGRRQARRRSPPRETFELVSRTLEGRPRRRRGTARRLAGRRRARPKTEMAVRAAAAGQVAVRVRGPARGRRDAVDGDATIRVLFGYAKGAAHACDLAAELRRRAQKLAEAAPKLRAKGARAALQALLDQNSLAAATPIAGLSERGTRRLLERLVALGAIRELTGRATFRLYGL